MKNISKFAKTGNLAVDMVAEAVYQTRIRKKPMRSITLKPALYVMFIYFLVKKLGEDKIYGPDGNVAAPIEFDGITILKGSNFQAHSLAFDYWPLNERKVEIFREVNEESGAYPEHISQVN